jgi:hypothetical protein
MPSPEASRRNSGKVRRVRWYNESQIIKRLIWQRLLAPEESRESKTQREWAHELGVTQQYVSRVERRWGREGLEFMLKLPQTLTLNDLRRVRELDLLTLALSTGDCDGNHCTLPFSSHCSSRVR